MRVKPATVVKSIPAHTVSHLDMNSGLDSLQKQIDEMRSRLARGTRENIPLIRDTDAVPQVPVPTPEPAITLRARVETKLREKSMTVQQLTRELVESTGKITGTLQELRAERAIYNVGLSDHPIWTLRIGDKTTTSELSRVVMRLISERPMTTREVADATGARLSRAEGVIVEIRRSTQRVYNLGVPGSARWFVMPEGATDAHLEPNRRRVPVSDTEN